MSTKMTYITFFIKKIKFKFSCQSILTNSGSCDKIRETKGGNMKNDVDKLEEIINDGVNIEQDLINHFKNYKDEELLTMKSSTGKTLVDLAINGKMQDFLCLVVEKYPNLAKVKDNKSGFTFLHNAAINKLENVLVKALDVDPELAKVQNVNDFTFLHFAARHGLENVLIKALDKNPELAKMQNKWGYTFLHDAAGKGLSKVLIKALDKNPELAEIQDNDGLTFLHYAAGREEKIVKDGLYSFVVPASQSIPEILIKALDINKNLAKIKDNKGATFLHFAARHGLENVLIKALDIDPELAKVQDIHGETFLYTAAECGLKNVLLRALDVDPELAKVKNKSGRTFLHKSASESLNDVLIKALDVDPELAKVQDNYGNIFLHRAALEGLYDVLIKALEVDKDLAKIQQENGNTFLHFAAGYKFLDILITASEIDSEDLGIDSEAKVKMEDVLIKALKKDPELAKVGTENGNTFLHFAAVFELENVLIEALGIDPELAKVRDKDGYTFLHFAAVSNLKDVIFKALKVNPKLLTIKDNDGKGFFSKALDTITVGCKTNENVEENLLKLAKEVASKKGLNISMFSHKNNSHDDLIAKLKIIEDELEKSEGKENSKGSSTESKDKNFRDGRR